MRRVQVIDSHTGGEPTRVVISGGPDLGSGSMAERRARFQAEHDDFRSAVVNEPRGSDVMVGALLCTPDDPANTCGVIFFNNVGYLGMCGHGTIGLVATLAYLGHIQPGSIGIETPVGTVTAVVEKSGQVAIENVPSYRHAKDVAVAGVRGDIAWGGNWFYLVSDHGQRLAVDNAEALTEFTWRIRQELEREGITGAGGGLIDHIELFSPSAIADSRNFVLCPGKAYDRSPCGTGTSAKLACLAADGKLREGEVWRQEGIAGGIFEGWYRRDGERIIPTIRGSAWVNAESTLVFDERDPFVMGIRR
ncbi:MAG: proline racemase family protein [Bryobacteraceae bacterium]